MKKILLLLAIVAATFTVEAQESFSFSKSDDYTFGKVSKEDLLKSDYALPTVSDAVVLDEYIRIMPSMLDIEAYINRGRLSPMIIREVIARKVKVLTEKGVENRKITIPLKYNSSTDCENSETYSVRAYSYTLKNNKVVRKVLKPSNITRREFADGSACLEFEIPNVEKGSIIEYGYTKAIITPNLCYERTMKENLPKLNSRYMVVLNAQHSDWFEIETLNNTTNVANDKINFDYPQSYGADAERAVLRKRSSSGWSGPRGEKRQTHNDKFITKTYNASSFNAIESGAGVTVTIKTDK